MTDKQLALLLDKYATLLDNASKDVHEAIESITLSDVASGNVARNKIFEVFENVRNTIDYDIKVLTEK